MTEPFIYSRGPAHRIWEMPDGTHREQRLQVAVQTIRLFPDASEVVKNAAVQTLLDEVSSRAAAETDEPLVATRFEGFKKEEMIGDDGFVWGHILIGTAISYYWPTMDAEDAA